MRRRSPRLLAIKSLFPDDDFKLRLLESAGSCHATLRQQVYSGTYDKPFVIDNRHRRFLHFDFGGVQSVMELRDPQRLALAYTRKMMAFLLFNSSPKRILLLGLGGGSLAKFCYHNLPDSSLTAIELSRHVIALRDEFGIPADNHRFRVINSDAAAYLSMSAHQNDVILADACDRTGIAADLASVEFYRNARSRLSPDGVLVVNVCGDDACTALHLSRLAEVFDDELLSVPVQDGNNLIVFGFRDRRPALATQEINAIAGNLKQRYRLDFPKYARKIARHAKPRRYAC